MRFLRAPEPALLLFLLLLGLLALATTTAAASDATSTVSITPSGSVVTSDLPAAAHTSTAAAAAADHVFVQDAFLGEQHRAPMLARITQERKLAAAADDEAEVRYLPVPAWLYSSVLAALSRSGQVPQDAFKGSGAAAELPVYEVVGDHEEHQDVPYSGPNKGRLAEQVAVVYLQGDGEFVLRDTATGAEQRVAIEPGKLISWPNHNFTHRVEGASPGLWRSMLGPMTYDTDWNEIIDVGPSPVECTDLRGYSCTSPAGTVNFPFNDVGAICSGSLCPNSNFAQINSIAQTCTCFDSPCTAFSYENGTETWVLNAPCQTLPTAEPTNAPSGSPTSPPVAAPTAPTDVPTNAPSGSPTSPPVAATTAPTDVPTKTPSVAPTGTGTASPTPFPSNPNFGRVTTDTYCAGATNVTTTSGGATRRERGLATAAASDTTYRKLAGTTITPVHACYQACYDLYAPPPNNAQFLFQLVPVNGGGQSQCQCCKTCDQRLPLPGAMLMEACAPSPLLRLGPKISRRYVKASGTKPVYVTYTLRVKSTAKHLLLRDMGVQVTLPANATAVKTAPSSAGWGKSSGMSVTVSGSVVTFFPVTLTGTKTRAFRVKVKLTPPFEAVAELRFHAQTFQNAYGLASDPYCAMPAREVAVTVKYF